MIGIFNTIKINNTEILRPSDFELTKEDVYAGEYRTNTGRLIADVIGWKYADFTLSWDMLPNDMISVLTNLTGEATLEFEDSDGSHTETIIRGGFQNTPTRFTNPDGSVVWKNVNVEVRFINTHLPGESE